MSLDTQVLGMILESVTDMPLREYLYKRIWSKIGTESEAYYIADNTGTDMALGGLNASLRDFAKFGQLYSISYTRCSSPNAKFRRTFFK